MSLYLWWLGDIFSQEFLYQNMLTTFFLRRRRRRRRRRRHRRRRRRRRRRRLSTKAGPTESSFSLTN